MKIFMAKRKRKNKIRKMKGWGKEVVDEVKQDIDKRRGSRCRGVEKKAEKKESMGGGAE